MRIHSFWSIVNRIFPFKFQCEPIFGKSQNEILFFAERQLLSLRLKLNETPQCELISLAQNGGKPQRRRSRLRSPAFLS